MPTDPIGPLIVAADEAVRNAGTLRDHLAQALDRHQIARDHQPEYGQLDQAIWTLQGRLTAYRQGNLAGALPEQAGQIQEALDAVEAVAKPAQHVLSQLP
jgi:hypothetical protein